MFSWRSHLTKEQYRHFRIHNFAFSICIWYFTVTPCWLATNTFFILLRVYIVRVTIFPCFFVLAFELHETEMGLVISIFHIHLEWNDFCSHEHFCNLPPSAENSVPNNFFWKTMLAKLLFSSWNISICLNSFYQKLAHTKKLMKNINSVAIVNDSSSLSFFSNTYLHKRRNSFEKYTLNLEIFNMKRYAIWKWATFSITRPI